MMLKFLNGESERVELDYEGIKIEFDCKVISTREQAHLMDLGALPRTVENTQRYFAAALKTCVDNLRVGDVDVPVSDLADRADMSDKTTVAVIRAIVDACDERIYAGVEDQKKSD